MEQLKKNGRQYRYKAAVENRESGYEELNTTTIPWVKGGRERGEEDAAGEPQMEERLLTAETATLWWRTVVAIVIATAKVLIVGHLNKGGLHLLSLLLHGKPLRVLHTDVGGKIP